MGRQTHILLNSFFSSFFQHRLRLATNGTQLNFAAGSEVSTDMALILSDIFPFLLNVILIYPIYFC